MTDYSTKPPREPSKQLASAGALLELRDWSLIRENPEGPVTLLRDIDLSIQRGEWLGILGANGSGKTSLLRYLACEESPLNSRSAMVFQDPEEGIVAGTVAEEMTLGNSSGTSESVQRQLAQTLADYDLTRYEHLAPQLLSAGQKQRLAVAVALARRPEILLCDEPTSLQDREGSAWLLQHLRNWWRESGGTVLFATQRHHEALLADRLVLLRDGRVVAAGSPSTVLSHPEAVRLLDAAELETVAGTVAGSVTGPATGSNGDTPDDREGPVARWVGVGCRYQATGDLFRAVNLIIPPGSRIGLTGPNGCGKSTLLAMAVGWRPPDQGRCHLLGRPLCLGGKADLDHGGALLAPQFPEYLFTCTSVEAEIALDPALGKIEATQLLQTAGLRPDILNRNPHELSSGQKRRLALALVIHSGRPLLLLDEPTAGLDRPGRHRLLDLLAQVPDQTAMVVASQDEAFLQACGCQIQVLTPHGLQPLAAGRLEAENSQT